MNLHELISSFYQSILYDPDPFEEPLPYSRSLKPHQIAVQFKGEKEPSPYSIKEFEDLMGITYARHLVFPSKQIYHIIKEECKKLFDSGKVETSAEWMGVIYRNQIDTGNVLNNVSIQWVDNDVGFGLFAEKTIPEGTLIGEYTGLVRRCFPFIALPNRYCFRYPLYNLTFGSYTIDAEKFTNEVSFINHSKNPNSTSVISINHHILHVLIRTKKALKQGEEITFDYGSPLEEILNEEYS